MERDNTVVVISSADEHRWIDLGLDGMKRRILD
jgi:hypothetical protein